jgi:anti-anti-sigma regulatory factor
MSAASGGFREAIDWRTGTVSAQGHLTTQGADLIHGAVVSLHRSGHERITVDLQGLRFADTEGLVALRRLTDRLRARSWDLLVLSEENLS